MAEIIDPRGRAVSSVGLGSRVVLKGDLDSPVMTAIAPMYQQNTGLDVVAWVCGWFNTASSPQRDSMGNELVDEPWHTTRQWNQIQLPLPCIELAEVQ